MDVRLGRALTMDFVRIPTRSTKLRSVPFGVQKCFYHDQFSSNNMAPRARPYSMWDAVVMVVVWNKYGAVIKVEHEMGGPDGMLLCDSCIFGSHVR